jgi:hypothetical protein
MQKIRLVLFYAWNYNTCCARVYKLPTSNYYYYYFLFSSVFLFLILIFFLRHRFLFTVIII